MADLSQEEWKNYAEEDRSEVYKKIATVMQKGIQPNQVASFYSDWAVGDQYEKELPDEYFNSPRITALSAADSVPEHKRADAKVFDVAAGTGLCAVELWKLGFRHIDALDPSEGMLERARQKNVYERIICDFLTDSHLDIQQDTYDVLTGSAGFGEGHMPCSALHEMIRVVKPGGIIVLVTRAEHLDTVVEYKDRLEPLMTRLETEGKWKCLKREIFNGFFLDKKGIHWKFQVCNQ